MSLEHSPLDPGSYLRSRRGRAASSNALVERLANSCLDGMDLAIEPAPHPHPGAAASFGRERSRTGPAV